MAWKQIGVGGFIAQVLSRRIIFDNPDCPLQSVFYGR